MGLQLMEFHGISRRRPARNYFQRGGI